MRHLDTQDEPVVRVRQVLAVGLPVQHHVLIVRDGQQFFEILGLPHQPVRVVDDHMPVRTLAHPHQ